MTATADRRGGALTGGVGRFQLFAFGFGSIVGSAWVVILGQWLRDGGPGGAVVGFLAGGTVMLAVCACYAEMTTRIPAVGGDFVFALRVYGRPTAFFVGWFLALAWISVVVFEGLALPKFIAMLLPDLGDQDLYRLFDSTITRNQLVIGAVLSIVIGTVNYRGARMAARFQALFTYGFLAVAIGCLVWLAFGGHAENLKPVFPANGPSSWWVGAAGVFANCAFLLNGFQATGQMVEERSGRIALPSLAHIMMSTVAAAALFYCIVVLATGTAAPWQSLTSADLATVTAARRAPGGAVVATLLLIAATASLMKTWNGVFLMAVRVLVALARQGFLPSWLAISDGEAGVPTRPVLIVAVINVLGLLLGRGAIGALVDMSATSIVFCFILTCLAVPILRRRTGVVAPFQVPGGVLVLSVAIGGAILMFLAAIVTPIAQTGGLPLQHILLLGWLGIGVAFWLLVGRRQPSLTDIEPPAVLAS